MALTPAQKVTLKADALANADTLALATAGNLDGLAELYNAPSSPVFWVWRTFVPRGEVVGAASRTGTSFSWSGVGGFISRSVGEQTAWRELFNSSESINPSLPNVRQAFTDIFSGGGAAATNNLNHLGIVGRRQASRIERLFATGTGLDTSAGAGTMAYEGPVPYTEFIGMFP